MFTLFYFREGEDWSRLRKALAPKMLRPKDIRENLDNFNAVTRDAIEYMVAVRGADDVIPDLEGELAKWATECKFCSKFYSFWEQYSDIKPWGNLFLQKITSLFQ